MKVVFICRLSINVLTSQSFQPFIKFKMKKYTLLYILATLAVCSCGNNQNSSETTGTEKNSNTQKATNAQHASDSSTNNSKANKIIHKTIPIASEFTHLLSVSGANIIYTQGDYNIEAIGDSSVLSYLATEFDSNTLTISIGTERNQDLNIYEGKLNITINISAPNLQCVSLCSSGDFQSIGTWKADKIELGIIGSGTFSCDTIDCTSFDLSATGNGNGNFSHIKSHKIHFANVANTNITADINTDLISCENSGNSTITFTGRATSQQFYPTKTGKILFK